jgi:hypothetical protein
MTERAWRVLGWIDALDDFAEDNFSDETHSVGDLPARIVHAQDLSWEAVRLRSAEDLFPTGQAEALKRRAHDLEDRAVELWAEVGEHFDQLGDGEWAAVMEAAGQSVVPDPINAQIIRLCIVAEMVTDGLE